MPFLTPAQARAAYDRSGAIHDRLAFYTRPALDTLVSQGAFGSAKAVVEFGCGTGQLAGRLLRRELPPTATYLGVDLSPVMVRITGQRLEPFGVRAQVLLSDGSTVLDLPNASMDRFVTTYVLDLLRPEEASRLLREAHRVLRDRGQLCLVTLARGRGASWVISRVWEQVHAIRPALVGGCRPVDLLPLVPASDWHIEFYSVVTACAVASEIVVASRHGEHGA